MVDPVPRTTSPVNSTKPPSPERYPVVIAEDDPAVRALLARVLSSRGYVIHDFANAEDALRCVRQLESLILVVDRMLPGITGVELVERTSAMRRDFEAVLVTAYADVESLSESLRLGVFRCILKPFQIDDVVAAVAGAANRLWLRLDRRARAVELQARNAELETMVARLHEAEKRRALDERLTSIGRLAAGVAHEINTPLAALIANLALLAEDLPVLTGDASGSRLRQARETLEDARRAADRVRVIVRDLKAFSRNDDETIGPVDVRHVIDTTLNLVRNEIRHRARLVKDIEAAPPVRANEARLGQVVVNLLLNAAQSIPDGSASDNEIRVHVRSEDEQVLIEVSDTGAGMEPDVVNRIFEPFFTTKPIGLGTGLGLWISHGIVTSFGGRIDVESQTGKGSSFRVWLPMAVPEPVAPGTSAPPPTSLRGRVLAIDDDSLLLSTMARVLGSQFEVVTVMSAREARDLIAKTEFDVILCDLMMPEMTGMDLHEELSTTMPAEVDKMIFLTGGTFTPRAQSFLDSVPNHRLEKPFDPKQMRALILDRIGRRPVRQA